jgi:hypothetical protein
MTDIVWVGIGVVLWGLHIMQGLLAPLIAETAPVELRGTAFGMFNLMTDVALLSANVVAGALWDIVAVRALHENGLIPSYGLTFAADR